ncbi:aminoglycoside 3'-phosphotransferase-2 [Rhizobium sp. BK529]|uniref:APH(3')-II family aminoglycoside O-phosphotransferase n=1 Tax=unclassified Rhizobium TaxID=2613769 RepID=UPI00104F46DC|nr:MULTISPECIES: APH(3') family aminoglycoside O-phosphotransferase [unclassified Rhizobium]MBB3590148.1 aminoglycoside 3'-phosphotransferase-2 [Rhizobium sp. BK529]TCS04844.1 aminoglycoside 3'-phosphotransferase-2 [Rhizobium sp. BK418]
MVVPLQEDGRLPVSLRSHLGGYQWRRDALGRSSACVFRLEGEGRPGLYLKGEEAGPFCELADEAERLVWLRSQGLDCPEVIAYESDGERSFLLMTALPGADLVTAAVLLPEERVEILASALSTLHNLDVNACPFDHRLENRLLTAEARMRAGLVDETDFDEKRLGKSAFFLFGELQRLRPDSENLVVAHGDACLPNFMAAGGRFAGYIDCCRLGVADRYQDIALACRSIAHNFGGEFVRLFLNAYGLSIIDPERIEFYQLLDEFF